MAGVGGWVGVDVYIIIALHANGNQISTELSCRNSFVAQQLCSSFVMNN